MLSCKEFCYVFTGVDGFSIDITTLVDIRDQTNKELAMRLATDIQTGGVFYTDLNGFQVGCISNNVHILTARKRNITISSV